MHCFGRAEDSCFSVSGSYALPRKVSVSGSWTNRIVIVDCVCTSLLFKKKLQVLESESVLVENMCKTFFYILFVRGSSFCHDVNIGLFKAVS